MKKLTQDPVVPTISESVCCEMCGRKVTRAPGLPIPAIKRRILANRFSLELKS
jgi:hypothetical protein